MRISVGLKRSLWASAFTAWLLLIGVGLYLVGEYTVRPGEIGHIATGWPEHLPFEPDSQNLTVLMAVHPKCVCTEASVDELAKLVAHANGHLTAIALLLVPRDSDLSWSDAPIRKELERIPGVEVRDDLDGHMAETLGARTSGHVFVYSPDGLLKFHGGITSSRGHRGDNTGRSAIEALANQRQAVTLTTPVFGCALYEEPAARKHQTCEACTVGSPRTEEAGL